MLLDDKYLSHHEETKYDMPCSGYFFGEGVGLKKKARDTFVNPCFKSVEWWS